MKSNTIFARALTLMVAVLISGCGTKTVLYGQAISEKNKSAIIDILRSPNRFEGKTVRVEGKISEVCPSGCWLRVKDDTGTLFVDILPSNFVIPQAVGHQAVVEGRVKKEALQVTLVGTGVEIK
ncbi:MAG: DUF4920 domain-containing protein [Candidatus Omnitrophota bacterium]